MARGYIPKRGDLVWLQFHPQAGHEQMGRRPAVVLSPESYNRKTSLALFCPVTSHAKGYPFETALPPGIAVRGVALCDQIKSLDWSARHAEFIGELPEEILDDILGKALALLK